MKRHMKSIKEDKKYRNRQYNQKHRKDRRDEFSTSRKTAVHKLHSLYRRNRELKQDPNTSHPLSVEEFDSIPDITENYKKEK